VAAAFLFPGPALQFHSGATVVSVLPATLISGVRGHDLAMPDYEYSLQSSGEASKRHPDEFQSLRRIRVAILGMLVGQDCLLDVLGSHGHSVIACFEMSCFEVDVVLLWLGLFSCSPAADAKCPLVRAVPFGSAQINDRWEDSRSSASVKRHSV
jgi:hypothetical protein